MFTSRFYEWITGRPPEDSNGYTEDPEGLRKSLEKRIEVNKDRLYEARFLKRLCLLGVGGCVAFTPAIFALWGLSTSLGLLLLAYALLLLVWGIYFRSQEADRRIDIQDAEGEKDLLTIRKPQFVEQRAEKLFKLHQLELKRYYDQTLKHSSQIFSVGIVCLVIGFVVVGATIYILISPPPSAQPHDLSDKVAVAILGAIGGLLSNFIAAIYLRMHAGTLKSLTDFHKRLVTTHHLHFGNFLIAKIANNDLRDGALANIAENMIQAIREIAQDETHGARAKGTPKENAQANGQAQGA